MKQFSADAASRWLTWIGAALILVAAFVVIAAIAFTRGVDELARTATLAGALAFPGLLSVVIGRLVRSNHD